MYLTMSHQYALAEGKGILVRESESEFPNTAPFGADQGAMSREQ
jgi:hypothetical protein